MSVREEWNMECPKCHDDNHIEVTVKVDAALTEDGTDVFGANCGDQEWDETSPARCNDCYFSGTVAEFTIGHSTSTYMGLIERISAWIKTYVRRFKNA